MDSWTLKDIPIAKNSVWTEPNPLTGEIRQITEIAGKAYEEIIHTKSQQTRNALIDLGWTPPPDDKPKQRPVFDMERLLNAQIKSEEMEVMGRKLADMSRWDLLVFAVDWVEAAMEQMNARDSNPQPDKTGV